MVFNLLAVDLVLLGYRHMLLQTSKARGFAMVCAGLGIVTFHIHLGFAIFGHCAFHLPLSMTVIAACLVSAMCLLRSLRTVVQGRPGA